MTKKHGINIYCIRNLKFVIASFLINTSYNRACHLINTLPYREMPEILNVLTKAKIHAIIHILRIKQITCNNQH